jgi:hypothetical protein
VPAKNVTIRNNLRREPGLLVILEGPEKQLSALVQNWQVDHNGYPREVRQGEHRLLKRNIWPRAARDTVGEPRFLSSDPAHPDYLRLLVDNAQAKGGAGGDWPDYLGALPPGPAPKQGDWFTRLRQKWQKELMP